MAALEDIIRQRIMEFHEDGIPQYYQRDIEIPFIEDMSNTIIGGRKVGKTYLTYQAIDHLLKTGKISSIKQVCYLHFDDETLMELRVQDLRLIESVFFSLQKETNLDLPAVFVFDEIHRIKGWENYILRLKKRKNWYVIITGSSADLKEDKVSRQLRGKSFTTYLHPLSFKEYLRFNEISVKEKYSTKTIVEYQKSFKNYLDWGSYPALPQVPIKFRRDLLRNYFNSIIASDFLYDKKIANVPAFKLFLRNLMQKNACCYWHKKEFNNISFAGYKISPTSLRNWYLWAEERFILASNHIYTDSSKKIEQNYRKIYTIDWALSNAVSYINEQRITQNLESLVYWHLHRKNYHITYLLVGTQKHEVDFLVSEKNSKPHLAIQVCYNLRSQETIEREIRSLKEVKKIYPDIQCQIISGSDQKIKTDEQIEIIPAWRWCLEL